jgi:hypothetical protein
MSNAITQLGFVLQGIILRCFEHTFYLYIKLIKNWSGIASYLRNQVPTFVHFVSKVISSRTSRYKCSPALNQCTSACSLKGTTCILRFVSCVYHMCSATYALLMSSDLFRFFCRSWGTKYVLKTQFPPCCTNWSALELWKTRVKVALLWKQVNAFNGTLTTCIGYLIYVNHNRRFLMSILNFAPRGKLSSQGRSCPLHSSKQ